MRRTGPGQQQAELPPELAAHQDDAALTKTGKWRQRCQTWLTEHGPTYDLSEDLRLRQFVRQRGGAWIQAEPGLSAWVSTDNRPEH
jgi:hypothetical protein